MARRRKGRLISGILVLDKPDGHSSNWALQAVKRLFFAAKAGHTGSLDPLATGVLPICLGEATKFSQYLLDSDKTYRSTFTLGVTTTTSDAEGDVVLAQSARHITRQQVEDALRLFEGNIKQIPSMFSALKHQGQPLYKLARQGIEVERKVRDVTVFDIHLEAFRAGEHPEVDVYIACSKGTYVRSIAEDLGQDLGCGGHVSALRRVQAGPFLESQAKTLLELDALRQEDSFELLDELLLPITTALQHLPVVVLGQSAEDYLLHGHEVMVPKIPRDGEVQLLNEKGEFLGVGEITDAGMVKPRRLIATN